MKIMILCQIKIIHFKLLNLKQQYQYRLFIMQAMFIENHI